MPSMSYCMFENTTSDMHQCVEAMEEANTIEDLDFNEYEERGFEALYRLSKRYIKEYERLDKEFANE